MLSGLQNAATGLFIFIFDSVSSLTTHKTLSHSSSNGKIINGPWSFV